MAFTTGSSLSPHVHNNPIIMMLQRPTARALSTANATAKAATLTEALKIVTPLQRESVRAPPPPAALGRRDDESSQRRRGPCLFSLCGNPAGTSDAARSPQWAQNACYAVVYIRLRRGGVGRRERAPAHNWLQVLVAGL